MAPENHLNDCYVMYLEVLLVIVTHFNSRSNICKLHKKRDVGFCDYRTNRINCTLVDSECTEVYIRFVN